jgi:putative ABC transport system substrate-binding protein
MRGLDRRQLLVAAAAWPFAAVAQPRVRRIGFLAQIRRPEPFDSHIFGTLARALRELGYVDGQNLAIDWRFGQGDVAALPALAAALVQAQPELVVTAGTLSAVAVRKASTTVPVVFGNVSDALGAGLVQSLAKPGTNCTGVVTLQSGILPKLLEVVLEALPGATRFALLTNPLQPASARFLAGLHEAPKARSVRVAGYGASKPPEIEAAFAAMQKDGVEVLLVPVEGLFIQQRAQLVELARRHRIALTGVDDDLAEAGALLTYGADQHAMFRKVAGYADRILRGAAPQDLPVEQPSAFVLALNRKTERALQAQLPYALVVRADRVIE